MNGSQELAGDLTVLKKLLPGNYSDLHTRLQDADVFEDIGRSSVPKKEVLVEDLESGALVAYHIVERETHQSLGYGFLVAYDGSPYLVLDFFDAHPLDIDIAGDALVQMAIECFRTSEEDSLYVFVDKPVSENMHDKLLEWGFDEIEDYPAINNQEETCYCLERYTYEAYYDNQDEEAEEWNG